MFFNSGIAIGQRTCFSKYFHLHDHEWILIALVKRVSRSRRLLLSASNICTSNISNITFVRSNSRGSTSLICKHLQTAHTFLQVIIKSTQCSHIIEKNIAQRQRFLRDSLKLFSSTRRSSSSPFILKND